MTIYITTFVQLFFQIVKWVNTFFREMYILVRILKKISIIYLELISLKNIFYYRTSWVYRNTIHNCVYITVLYYQTNENTFNSVLKSLHILSTFPKMSWQKNTRMIMEIYLIFLYWKKNFVIGWQWSLTWTIMEIYLIFLYKKKNFCVYNSGIKWLIKIKL
jgi:hypothetical protein